MIALTKNYNAGKTCRKCIMAVSNVMFRRGCVLILVMFVFTGLYSHQLTSYYAHLGTNAAASRLMTAWTPPSTNTSTKNEGNKILNAFDTVLNENKTVDTESLHILFQNLSSMKVRDEEINLEVEAQRCQRYNFNLATHTNHTFRRRRIFYGSLVAQDSWHTLAFNAMEAFGVYHVMALVENNKTHGHLGTRDFRMYPGSSMVPQHVYWWISTWMRTSNR